LLLDRLNRFVRRILFGPRLQLRSDQPVERLGSDYGGWEFVPTETLRGSTVVSCGLGEDASFDVEFASRYGARVIIVDPTPRAIRHFEQIIDRVGEPRMRHYVSGGRQPVDTYELSSINAGQLVLVPKALWTEKATLPFFLPDDPAHVSHSLVDQRRDHGMSSRKIDVETTTLETLMIEHGIEHLPLLKLDIEGAEVPVIGQLLRTAIRPDQILVEFDGLTRTSRSATQEWKHSDDLLQQAGYHLRHWDRRSNFLYTR
jgi:FkbM family methyltransferase